MNRSIAVATIPEARLSRGLGLVPHLEEEGPGALAQGGACLLGDGGVGGVGGAKDHAQLRLGRRINGRSLNLLLFRCFITYESIFECPGGLLDVAGEVHQVPRPVLSRGV